MTSPVEKQKTARNYFIYYVISLSTFLVIPLIRNYFGEGNLPPLKVPVRFSINLLYLNLAASFFLFIKNSSQGKISGKGWAFLALLGVLWCSMPPIFSGDLMEHLLRGRILGVYHLNPYQHVPGEFPNDLLYPYSVWREATHAYGPILVYTQALPGLFFKNSILGMTWSYKLFYFVCQLLASYYFLKIIDKFTPAKAVPQFLLFALNPLLIVSTLIDGHPDILMLCFTLMSVYFLLSNRSTLSFLLWSCAFLTKYTVIILLPILVIVSVKREWEGQKVFPWFFILKQAALNLAFMAAVFAPVWTGWDTFKVPLKMSGLFYTNTIPYLAHQALQAAHLNITPQAVKVFVTVSYLIFYIYVLLAFCKRGDPPWRRFFRLISLVYLFFYGTIIFPFGFHYLMWGLPWLILAEWPMPNLLIALYSFAGLFSYFKRINYLLVLAAAIYFIALWINHRKGLRRQPIREMTEKAVAFGEAN